MLHKGGGAHLSAICHRGCVPEVTATLEVAESNQRALPAIQIRLVDSEATLGRPLTKKTIFFQTRLSLLLRIYVLIFGDDIGKAPFVLPT